MSQTVCSAQHCASLYCTQLPSYTLHITHTHTPITACFKSRTKTSLRIPVNFYPQARQAVATERAAKLISALTARAAAAAVNRTHYCGGKLERARKSLSTRRLNTRALKPSRTYTCNTDYKWHSPPAREVFTLGIARAPFTTHWS